MVGRRHKIVTQIYEIQDPWEAESVIAVGVDRIGSVLLAPDEWKLPEIRDASRVSKAAGGEHSIIPLFDDREISARVIDYYEPDLLHFCDALSDSGQERETTWQHFLETQRWLKKRYPELKLMRSIPVPPSTAKEPIPLLELAGKFEGVTDYYLTDTWVGNASETPFIGITGRPCDWDAARALVDASRLPVILAGGLSPENVYPAILSVKPFGVDSCTMTNLRDSEGNPIRFRKDLGRVRAFVEEVRRAERDLRDE